MDFYLQHFSLVWILDAIWWSIMWSRNFTFFIHVRIFTSISQTVSQWWWCLLELLSSSIRS